MAKRLFMTTADYVTIALSPALVMLLVGSLVYFLIEVLYVGEYEARLMYVFGLFVFAAVLVARISMESGAEYASLFALPLGLATFAVLAKFVEHASPFSWLINIGLMGVVWWCAHQLTWDCTLIDDEEDSSGEGLMQRIGIDDTATASDLPVENELLADKEPAAPWWRRLLRPKGSKHTPGVWVLYFSLAALPLFGIGQHWVPAAELGRRRYVFALLLIYVASALALLVTTSFLGLRRYLRQRRIEMPAPMAATWVTIGAVLITIVMLLAALVPRPRAEFALSQVPWQATSPGGQTSSRYAAGRDGSEEFDSSGSAIQEEAPQGDAVREDAGGKPAASDEGQPSDKPGGTQQDGGEKKNGGETDDDSSTDGSKAASESPRHDSSDESSGPPNQESDESTDADRPLENDQQSPGGGTAKVPVPQHPADERPFKLPEIPEISWTLFAGALKLVFYAAVVFLAALFFWRNRHALAQAVRDILQRLRELLARLFGGRAAASETVEETAAVSRRRLRPFADYRNPFTTGDYRRWPPEEVVRYTFEAFEAWAREAGHERSPDQTPTELVHIAVPPQSPLFSEARRMVQLYSEVAYAARSVSPAAVEGLQGVWNLMHSVRVTTATTV